MCALREDLSWGYDALENTRVFMQLEKEIRESAFLDGAMGRVNKGTIDMVNEELKRIGAIIKSVVLGINGVCRRC